MTVTGTLSFTWVTQSVQHATQVQGELVAAHQQYAEPATYWQDMCMYMQQVANVLRYMHS